MLAGKSVVLSVDEMVEMKDWHLAVLTAARMEEQMENT